MSVVGGSSGRGAIPSDLLAWAAKPGPASVLRAARERCEAGQSGTRLALDVPLDERDRRTVSDLLGLQWRASDAAPTLGMVRSRLAERGVALEDLLAVVGGPLRDRRAEVVQERQTRAATDNATLGVLTAAGLSPALARVAAARWLGPRTIRLETARQVVSVLSRLPAPAGTLLATLASDLFADPHALDKDRLLGRACVRVLAAAGAGQPQPEVAAPSGNPGTGAGDSGDGLAGASGLDAEWWRRVWENAGVACDRVSSTVLVLNLPSFTGGDHRYAAAANILGCGAALGAICSASSGEPLWLTARLLSPGFALPPGSAAGITVRVCENPAVIEAAADHLGSRCPPIVCTYGRPSLAARTLLTALFEAGAKLLLSADRDAAGSSILDGLLTEFGDGAQLWLPNAVGIYEEERLTEMLADLAG